MVGGPMMLLRQSLQSTRYAPMWQQLLIALALVVGGIGLTLVGHPAGIIATVVGCMFFLKKAQLWLGGRRGGSER